jgi:hypothetical protein
MAGVDESPWFENTGVRFCARDIGAGRYAEQRRDELMEGEDGRRIAGGVASFSVSRTMNPGVLYLRSCWIAERGSAALQPYCPSVTAVAETLQQQSSLVSHMNSAPGIAAVVTSIYAMDIDRVRYLLAAYTRTRLRKVGATDIHAHVLYIPFVNANMCMYAD